MVVFTLLLTNFGYALTVVILPGHVKTTFMLWCLICKILSNNITVVWGRFTLILVFIKFLICELSFIGVQEESNKGTTLLLFCVCVHFFWEFQLFLLRKDCLCWTDVSLISYTFFNVLLYPMIFLLSASGVKHSPLTQGHTILFMQMVFSACIKTSKSLFLILFT